MEDAGDELDLLLVSLRQLLDLAVEVLGDPEALQPFVDDGARIGIGDAIQRREEAQLLADLHPRVEAALLGQVAPRSAGEGDVLGPHPCHAAGIGSEDVEHDSHRGRLAGAVRAEETEDPPRLDREADTVEGDDLAEALVDAFDDKAHGSSPLGSW